MTGYSHDACATIVLVEISPRWVVIRAQVLKLGKINNYFSFSVVCIAPISTINLKDVLIDPWEKD